MKEEEQTRRSRTPILLAVVCTAILLGGFLALQVRVNELVMAQNRELIEKYNDLVAEYNKLAELLNGENPSVISGVAEIHSRVRMWQYGMLIFDEYNAGAVTDFGDNMTLFKIFGDTDMQVGNTAYNVNCTYISIGNDTGTLATTSTVLPNEWNRTLATVEDESQSWLNLTCTYYPSGSQTADCIGINCNSTANSNNLMYYDTFTQVTGIDDTFTINVEFKILYGHT